jgi:hypothetical protein
MITTISSPASLRRSAQALLGFLFFTVGWAESALAQSVVPPSPDTAEKSQTDRTQPDESPLDRKIDLLRFSGGASSHYYNVQRPADNVTWLFLPPVPPPLESELPVLPPFSSNLPAAPELAEFVSDLFYPMLADRLAARSLSKTMRAELQTYRTAKLELQNQLRSRIADLADAPPLQKEQELGALAVSQRPRIAELEALAEKIRADLLPAGLFGAPVEPKNLTKDDRPREPPARESDPPLPDAWLQAQALRIAAFYGEGLSAAQRRLLLEAPGPIEGDPNSNAISEEAARDGWLLSFSPETARIHLTANLPAPLARKISEYAGTKQALKEELREVLQAHATSRSNRRTAALRELAATQAQRIAALEPLAEEIRRELARLPNPPGPPPAPSLPPELAARIASYRAHKIELLKTLYAMLTGVARPPAQDAGTASADKGSPLATGPWLQDDTAQTRVQSIQLKVSRGEFNSAQNRLLADLNKEQAGIREALAEYFRTTNQPMDRKSINDLLKDFETSRQKQEIWDKYRDYQTAVLMPGLAPEQRRLLFDAAVEHLGLHLPAGERVP